MRPHLLGAEEKLAPTRTICSVCGAKKGDPHVIVILNEREITALVRMFGKRSR